MNDIKARIKSVSSTMQITKAMELVATSKLRRAKEKAEASRSYHRVVFEAISQLAGTPDTDATIWSEQRDGKTLFVVIAGDRGLAGGYNANVFRLTEALASGNDAVFFPIGKKALDYYRHRNCKIFSDAFREVSEVGVGDALTAAELICRGFEKAEFTKVVLVYTQFVSMISQLPTHEILLPLKLDKNEKADSEPIFDGEFEEILTQIIPQYVGGIIHSAVSEALASESGARRSAMNAANKNAAEMIDELMLKYNRARQSVITQEITEIVSGAEAL